MREDKKQIIKDIDTFLYKRDRVQVFIDAVEFDALDLAIQTIPDKLEERLKRMNDILDIYADERDRKMFDKICKGINEMLSHMIDDYGDHLGEIYMELSGNKKGAGQYFTPYHVSRLMAELALGEQELSKDEILTFDEPCCGSGGIIVAVADALNKRGFNYANNAVFVANDIDRNCTLMCYLQTSWAGMPAIVYHQNTLTQETWDMFVTPAFILQYPKFHQALKSQPTM